MYQPKLCQLCGAAFIPNSGFQKFCGQECFQEWREGDERVCTECGQEFKTRRNGPARFCSRSCVSKDARRRDPETTRKSMAAARAAWSRPEVAAKMKAWRHSPNNPILQPDVRARARATSAARGWPGLTSRGEVPAMQQQLADRLGWPVDVRVNTHHLHGRARSRTTRAVPPYWYLLDIANVKLKIDVEVDGNSHRGNARRMRDQRRDARLTDLGWTVVRVTNREVEGDMEAIVQKVQRVVSTISRRRAATTSPTAS